VIDKINAWFKEILSQKDTVEFLNKFGGDAFISTPEEAQALFIKEEKAWAEYVRLAKIEKQ
jgi:tripartite-type tricarboxylate transporter receptor subunit TctC